MKQKLIHGNNQLARSMYFNRTLALSADRGAHY